MKAKWTRYGPLAPVETKAPIQVNGRLCFEPSRCIRCGLCVYNTSDGFTFKGRGFEMQVVIPEENKKNIDEKIADICPTGALFIRQLHPDE
jgi:ferredoxin